MCHAMLRRLAPGLQIAAKSQKQFVGQSDNYHQLDISKTLKSVGELYWKSLILPMT